MYRIHDIRELNAYALADKQKYPIRSGMQIPVCGREIYEIQLAMRNMYNFVSRAFGLHICLLFFNMKQLSVQDCLVFHKEENPASALHL